MSTEYGSKIAGALKAVVQMHSDTSKLLVDCDKHIGNGRSSVFGSYATKELTYNFQAKYWMAEAVYRYYQAGPSEVEGVTVSFFDTEAPIEPVLLIARIHYSSSAKPKEWDIWNLYFAWDESKKSGEVSLYAEADEGRIEWARLIAVPLFSITRIDDAVELMERVRAAAAACGA